MDKRFDMRASDAERQAVVQQLNVALEEGRIQFYEYDERIGLAYQASTYGELQALFDDLPTGGVLAQLPPDSTPTLVEPAAQAPAGRRGPIAELPTWIRILWTIWFAVALINLAIWALVSVSSDAHKAFWPMWVVGPSGAVLIGLSIMAVFIERARREAALRKAAQKEQRRRKKNKNKYKAG
ncbi:DUF1707 SHOCT-like domain-containing protein [Micromonosporaceae bacterium Da 78-11]